MIWTNETKNTTVFTNQAKGAAGLTWDQADFSWDNADGTWDNPFGWTNETKNTTTFTNQAKN